eukprot:GEMP01057960.1.p1 GENE.GEMP01057960.1~~GEMP01057960.1.p1  ORF type:complete len:311 (+),score=52.45 GEMP01057960.1:415-1347(+)
MLRQLALVAGLNLMSLLTSVSSMHLESPQFDGAHLIQDTELELPDCTSGTTAQSKCVCTDESTTTTNRTKAECQKSQTCQNGSCTDVLVNRVPPEKGELCPPSALVMVSMNVRNRHEYKYTDDDGNCACPPNYVCFSTEMQGRVQDLLKEVSGNKEAVDSIKAILKKSIVVLGCPARASDMMHWRTSRTKFSWRVRSSVCAPLDAQGNVILQHESTDDATGSNSWSLFFGLLLVLLVIALCLLLRSRQQSAARPSASRSSFPQSPRSPTEQGRQPDSLPDQLQRQYEDRHGISPRHQTPRSTAGFKIASS